MTPPRSTENRTDRELVDAATSGDQAAMETLLRRHHDRLHLLCRRLCRDRGEAEDATQNALLAIVRGLGSYDGRAEFTTWSHRVATNACLDELRRHSRRPVAQDPTTAETFGDVSGAHWSSQASTRSEDPGDLVVSGEQRARLQWALDQLDETFRTPVVLRDVADMEYADIAELLDLAPGTVRSRISRGRTKLAALLGLDQDPETPHTEGILSNDSASDPPDGNRTGHSDVRTEDVT